MIHLVILINLMLITSADGLNNGCQSLGEPDFEKDPCVPELFCKENTIIPNHADCNTYLNCNNGDWVVRPCNNGSLFHKDTYECCFDQEDDICFGECPPYTGPPVTMGPAEPCEPLNEPCVSENKIADRNRCNWFFECIQTTLSWIEKECSLGTFYDPVTEGCVGGADVNCEYRCLTTAVPPTTLVDATTTNNNSTEFPSTTTEIDPTTKMSTTEDLPSSDIPSTVGDTTAWIDSTTGTIHEDSTINTLMPSDLSSASTAVTDSVQTSSTLISSKTTSDEITSTQGTVDASISTIHSEATFSMELTSIDIIPVTTDLSTTDETTTWHSTLETTIPTTTEQTGGDNTIVIIAASVCGGVVVVVGSILTALGIKGKLKCQDQSKNPKHLSRDTKDKALENVYVDHDNISLDGHLPRNNSRRNLLKAEVIDPGSKPDTGIALPTSNSLSESEWPFKQMILFRSNALQSPSMKDLTESASKISDNGVSSYDKYSRESVVIDNPAYEGKMDLGSIFEDQRNGPAY